MHPAVNDIESLLAASRELLGAEELDFERLLAWSAERNGILLALKAAICPLLPMTHPRWPR